MHISLPGPSWLRDQRNSTHPSRYKRTGYSKRNYVEFAIRRLKGIFGNTLKARALPQQKTEAWIMTEALNRMTLLGMPTSVKIA